MDDLDLSFEPVEPGDDDWDDGGLEALAAEFDEPDEPEFLAADPDDGFEQDEPSVDQEPLAATPEASPADLDAFEPEEPFFEEEPQPVQAPGAPDSADPLGDLIASIDAAIAADVPAEPVEVAPRPEAIRRGHLVFSLSGRRFAAPIDRVVRLDRLANITPTPNTPPFVLGVANVHGAIVPTLDLRHLLGMPSAKRTPNARLVQLKTGAQELVAGVVVDALHGIRTFEHGRAKDEALHVLDVDALFSSAEIRDLMNGDKPRSG